MTIFPWLASLVLIGAGIAPQSGVAQTIVAVNGTPSHDIPPTLCKPLSPGDGGLYAELLQNRAFQQVTPGTRAALNAWSAVGGGNISVIADSTPLSSALPNALQLTIPSGSSGQVGLSNSGYCINVVSGDAYKASFYYRFSGTVPSSGLTANISLVSSSGTVFAISATESWTQAAVTLTPSQSSSDINNEFTVTVNGANLPGGTINFGLFSLFPPTFKNQPNGMRKDIAQALLDLGPSFFRFPGGNNLEGQTVATRWQWNNTVGPLIDRPGRVGDWSYVNTDGLGLLEYLVWIESMGMQSIMAVWAGFALGRTSVAEDQLGPYIEQARQQIEFVIGNTSTPGGAQRAALGHPEPFELRFVEVGNEDFLAPDTYTYRWTNFVNALQADYPDIRFLATTQTSSPTLTPKPQSYDVHVYQTPRWFAENSFFYDSFARDGTTYFEACHGEFAAISTNSSNIYGTPANGRLVFPTMQGKSPDAFHECAAFMTGLERNSDIVFAASYAPLLGHVTQNQWTPNLLSFDAGTVIKSTSYYVHQLFSLNRGDSYLPSTLPSASGTLFWSVTKQNAPAAFIIKISNTVAASADLVFQLPSAVASRGTAQILAGSQTASNTAANASAVAPEKSTIPTAQNLTFTAPGFSVSVLTVPVA
ncbi:alfa-L-arabinofuranosidase precursor [Amylostereum chailletii]|nr:alfa-L-arabinofuranosidase precursor [Amylostereum chailletii]